MKKSILRIIAVVLVLCMAVCGTVFAAPGDREGILPGGPIAGPAADLVEGGPGAPIPVGPLNPSPLPGGPLNPTPFPGGEPKESDPVYEDYYRIKFIVEYEGEECFLSDYEYYSTVMATDVSSVAPTTGDYKDSIWTPETLTAADYLSDEDFNAKYGDIGNTPVVAAISEGTGIIGEGSLGTGQIHDGSGLVPKDKSDKQTVIEIMHTAVVKEVKPEPIPTDWPFRVNYVVNGEYIKHDDSNTIITEIDPPEGFENYKWTPSKLTFKDYSKVQLGSTVIIPGNSGSTAGIWESVGDALSQHVPSDREKERREWDMEDRNKIQYRYDATVYGTIGSFVVVYEVNDEIIEVSDISEEIITQISIPNGYENYEWIPDSLFYPDYNLMTFDEFERLYCKAEEGSGDTSATATATAREKLPDEAYLLLPPGTGDTQKVEERFINVAVVSGWIEEEQNQGGSTGGGTTIKDEDTPLADLPEEQPPLSDGSNLDEVLEEEVPLADVPFTGENNVVYALGIIAALTVAAYVLSARKEER